MSVIPEGYPYVIHACDIAELERKVFPTHTHGMREHGLLEMVYARNHKRDRGMEGHLINFLFSYYSENPDEYGALLENGHYVHYFHNNSVADKPYLTLLATVIDSDNDEVTAAYGPKENGKFLLLEPNYQ